MIRRSAVIQLLLYLTIAAVVAAVSIKLYKSPAGPPGGDTFALVSPIFFGVAAKNARGWQRTAVVLAVLGFALALAGLFAAVSGKIG